MKPPSIFCFKNNASPLAVDLSVKIMLCDIKVCTTLIIQVSGGGGGGGEGF